MKGPVPATDLGGYQAPLSVRAAVAARAQVRCGGGRPEFGGTFFQPTVLTRARGLASRDG